MVKSKPQQKRRFQDQMSKCIDIKIFQQMPIVLIEDKNLKKELK